MSAPAAPDPTAPWVVAVDVGGSGSRLVAVPASPVDGGDDPRPARDAATPPLNGRPVRVGAAGSDAADVVAELVRRLRAEHPDRPVLAAAASVTGLASLVPDPATLHDVLAGALRTDRTAVAADALTAHLGALRGAPGAVIAVGTGAIALGTDLGRRWHRVDGWGHLLGDLGSGSWVGAAGLRAALAAHDGRATGGSATLLAAALERLGPVAGWPAALYGRDDRAHVLASFVPAVVRTAHAGDPVADQVLRDAGTHLGETLAASLAPGVPPLAAATGGLLQAGEPLVSALRDSLARRRPDVDLVPAAGGPLDGAVRLARALLDDGPGPGRGDGAPATTHEPWLTVRRPDGVPAARHFTSPPHRDRGMPA